MIQGHFSPQGPQFIPPAELLLPREAAHPQVPLGQVVVTLPTSPDSCGSAVARVTFL